MHFYVGLAKSTSRRNRQSDFDKNLDLESLGLAKHILFYDFKSQFLTVWARRRRKGSKRAVD